MARELFASVSDPRESAVKKAKRKQSEAGEGDASLRPLSQTHR